MVRVLDLPVTGPATHALVIAVGHYEPNEWNLPDLDSPVQSATAFIDWLQTERTSLVPPLASIDLLWSPAGGPVSYPDAAGNPIAIEAATMLNVDNAIQRWFGACHTSLENTALFYFCGHGFQKGASQSLLLEAFAAPGKLSVSNDAVDFVNFGWGMERCLARRQLYFLDTCRSHLAPSLKIPKETIGLPIVEPDYSNLSTTLARDWPVFCAAADGQSAFGANGKVSQFTAALLKALSGAGWNDDLHAFTDWCISSDTLATRVRDLLKYEEEVRGAPLQEAQRGGVSSGLVFHRAPPGRHPQVPVLIGCHPATDNASTHLEVRKAGVMVDTRPPAPPDWELQLPCAPDYQVHGTNGSSTRSQNFVLRPPCKIVRLS